MPTQENQYTENWRVKPTATKTEKLAAIASIAVFPKGRRGNLK
jgi:hypothetical protein